MAYTKTNKLKKTQDVQECFKSNYLPGVTIEHVYKTYIKDAFRISRSTFYKMMKVDAKKELQILLDGKENKATFKQTAMEFNEPVDATDVEPIAS